jgi:hypothetical protein
VDDVLDQLLQIIGTTIGEGAFRKGPNSFIRVQLRCIGGKMLDVESGMATQKLSQGVPLMGGRVIQEDNHRAAQMAQQLAEKGANFLLSDIVEVKLIVQAQALSSRTDGDSGNDRDLVSVPLAMIVNRSTPLRGPRLGYVRDQEKARLIGED